MAIDVRNFINVNIGYTSTPTVISQRDTAVLITSEGTSETQTFISSKQEWEIYISGKTFTNTTPYVNTFFSHGGANLLVLEGADKNSIKNLDDRHIVVAIVGQDLNNIKTVAAELDTYEGVHKKILVARIEYDDIYSGGGPTFTDPNVSGYNSLAIKYSELPGAEMAIAAYLTKINIYGTNTIHDYAYTSESIIPDLTKPINNAMFNTLMELNFNFNINIARGTKNIGGNLTNGRSLINEFMLIVLHQTITDNLLVLLMSKIKGNQGLASIRGVITQELNKYIVNGYLDKNKVWTQEDWTVEHNGQNFNIIRKGTPLTLGYSIHVLPWSALTSDDRQLRKAPPIYIVLADSYGIRHIEVTGEVI